MAAGPQTGPKKYAIRRATEDGRFIETVITFRTSRKAYDSSNRPRIMPKTLQRIIDAGQLLAQGLTMPEIARRLNVNMGQLMHLSTRHPALWKKAKDTATDQAAQIVRGIAGSGVLIEGKLLNLAAAAAARTGEPLLPDRQGLTLTRFLEEVYIPSRITMSAKYEQDLRVIVARFTTFLGRQPLIAELAEGDLCRYLKACVGTKKATSINSHRRHLLALWRAAYEHEFADRPPRAKRIGRIPEEADPPEAWTLDEVKRLIDRAALVNGSLDGIPARLWWTSLLLTVYWTGCRIGAMLATPSSAYSGDGILVRKQKNHKPQWYAIPETCRSMIDATRPETRELLWPWPYDRRRIWTTMRQIVETAGIKCPKGHGQLFHRLRRTTLSLCAAVDPAIAQRQAGHSSYALTQKHYIDVRVARGRTAADVLPDPLKCT